MSRIVDYFYAFNSVIDKGFDLQAGLSAPFLPGNLKDEVASQFCRERRVCQIIGVLWLWEPEHHFGTDQNVQQAFLSEALTAFQNLQTDRDCATFFQLSGVIDKATFDLLMRDMHGILTAAHNTNVPQPDVDSSSNPPDSMFIQYMLYSLLLLAGSLGPTEKKAIYLNQMEQELLNNVGLSYEEVIGIRNAFNRIVDRPVAVVEVKSGDEELRTMQHFEYVARPLPAAAEFQPPTQEMNTSKHQPIPVVSVTIGMNPQHSAQPQSASSTPVAAGFFDRVKSSVAEFFSGRSAKPPLPQAGSPTSDDEMRTRRRFTPDDVSTSEQELETERHHGSGNSKPGQQP